MHIPSIEVLQVEDMPSLQHMLDTARQQLARLAPHSSPESFKIGIPGSLRHALLGIGEKSHFAVQAYVAPADRIGYLDIRAASYSKLAWTDLEYAMAELKETASNVRVRTQGERLAAALVD